MATSCPNCENPLRPGAKYCGSCGTETPFYKAGPHAPGAGMVTCPHCGKLVRASAKFCQHCGEIIEGGTEETTVETPPVRTPSPQVSETPAPPPAIPERELPSTEPTVPRERPRAIWTRFLYIGIPVMVICCIGSIWLAWNYGWNPFSLTATPMSTPTLLPIPTSTPLPSPTFTPSPTPTAVPPSETPTVLPTTVPPPTETSQPTPTPQEPTPVPPVIQDNFDAVLDTNWIPWGEPAPSINDEGELVLAGEEPGAAGISSQQVISRTTGLVIQFHVRVNDPEKDLLSFDWDPGEQVREPGQGPGSIQLLVGKGSLQLLVIDGGFCGDTLTDTNYHQYQIRVEEDVSLTLLVDGETICSSITIPTIAPGRISFNGQGWVDDILVGYSVNP